MTSGKDKQGTETTGGCGKCPCVLVALYGLVAVLPLVLTLLIGGKPTGGLFRELGKGAALVGFSLVALQVVLSARFPFIDRAVGLDAALRVHKIMAVVAVGLLAAHPVLFMLDSQSLALLSLDMPWPITLGKIALILLILAILSAFFFHTFGIDYQVWRVAHKGMAGILLLGFTHSLVIGSDLEPAGMRVYWVLLTGAVVLLFAYRNTILPFMRRRFDVVAVDQENHNTYSIRLTPQDGGAFTHAPGQFWMLKLIRPGRRSEEHPFTIASSPTGEPPLTSTIKASGGYTRTMGQTRPGDSARVEGPFGRFSLVHHDAAAFLFIAGGVGITPIMSMLRYLRDTEDARPAALIYGNNTVEDILFRDELAALPGPMRVYHVLVQPPGDWDGGAGYVTGETVESQARDLLGKAHVYICGPPPMMAKVIPAVRALGVPNGRIHYERFAL